MSDPSAAADPVVRVAIASHQAEAEMLQQILEAEGIHSFLRRSPGFDVPEYLASGPRDVVVRGSDAPHARELLEPTGKVDLGRTPPQVSPVKLLAILVLAAALTWLLIYVAFG